MVEAEKGTEYFVHVDLDINSVLKKIKIYELYIADSNGEVICDMAGGTIGFYSGRLTRAKLKATVKSLIDDWLATDLGLKPEDFPLANIALKNEWEMDKVLERSKYPLYQAFKKSRGINR